MKNLTYVITAILLMSLAPMTLVAEEINSTNETVEAIRIFKFTHQDSIYQDEAYQQDQENIYNRLLDGKARD